MWGLEGYCERSDVVNVVVDRIHIFGLEAGDFVFLVALAMRRIALQRAWASAIGVRSILTAATRVDRYLR